MLSVSLREQAAQEVRQKSDDPDFGERQEKFNGFPNYRHTTGIQKQTEKRTSLRGGKSTY